MLRVVFALSLALGMLLFCGKAQAQAVSYTEEDLDPVHWAFSGFFGTGWYQIDNNRSVFVLRMPPRITLRDTLSDTGKTQSGLELHLPVTVGVHQIDDIPGILDPDNFGSISFTPGVEWVLPITDQWHLRPFVKAGIGYEFNDKETALIYSAGVKSRYQFFQDKVTWGLLSNFYYAGYKEFGGDSDDISTLLLGVEATHRLGPAKRGDDRYFANWHFSWTKLSRDLRFIDPEVPGGFNTLDSFFSVGVSLTPPEGRWDFWIYKPEQLGLAVEANPDGDYLAIKFKTRSWFTQ